MGPDIDRLIEKFKNLSLEESLNTLGTSGFKKMVFSTSLGQEDQLLTHVIFTNDFPIHIITLDTGRLFEETHLLLEKTMSKYQKSIEVLYPDSRILENFVNKTGVNSFYHSVDNRKRCCRIRKTDVLKRTLEGKDLWITGLRAQQSMARHDLKLFQWDSQFQITKFNPLVDWSLDKITNYLKEYQIPQNQLHDRGYISIGCAPCTRAVKPGEDIRSGRWWWENGKKECGIHLN